MESREGGELEELRIRKVELEIQVKALGEREAEVAQLEKERDKLAVKIQKYKVSLQEHQVSGHSHVFQQNLLLMLKFRQRWMKRMRSWTNATMRSRH